MTPEAIKYCSSSGGVRYVGKLKGGYTRQGCAVDGDLSLEDVDDI